MVQVVRADQVGSLIRPASLLAARSTKEIYKNSFTGPLETATQDAIATTVAKQLELSIRPITSGAYERTIFYSSFFENLKCMTTQESMPVPSGFRTDF